MVRGFVGSALEAKTHFPRELKAGCVQEADHHPEPRRGRREELASPSLAQQTSEEPAPWAPSAASRCSVGGACSARERGSTVVRVCASSEDGDGNLHSGRKTSWCWMRKPGSALSCASRLWFLPPRSVPVDAGLGKNVKDLIF